MHTENFKRDATVTKTHKITFRTQTSHIGSEPSYIQTLETIETWPSLCDTHLF